MSKMLDSHEMMSISRHKTESVFNDYIKISGIEPATGIAQKVAKAKQKAEVKIGTVGTARANVGRAARRISRTGKTGTAG